MKKTMSNKVAQLLEDYGKRYDRRFLSSDPIYFVHQYKDPRDQEVVALVSALLAFGNAKAIHGSVKKVLQLFGESPYQFVSSANLEKIRSSFQSLGHRWVRGEDIYFLCVVLRKIFDQHDSLKSFFLKNYDQDVDGAEILLNRFSQTAKSLAPPNAISRGFQYFFPAPKDGSPCKRLNLFLRWMVRPRDGIDLGLWPEISPSKLMIPLDVHVTQFAKKWKISRRKNPSWKMVEEVTHFLRSLDPEDPIKFDFAICHYGMEIGW